MENFYKDLDWPKWQSASKYYFTHVLKKEYDYSIDHLTIPSKRTGMPALRRVSEVFDCWFESGSMPYAQLHYPFENKKDFSDRFPADFIAEGIDQTRGWWVLHTVRFVTVLVFVFLL